ncbi:MAG: thioredoxin domain-containing protein [Sphingobacteriales bacterium]|nr:thioredoxin domain-containing protein [Sphingobacteriales bacterium]MBI3720168.1 thioredoxin domain-containing protein [Sphingobacteriales bacterium]
MHTNRLLNESSPYLLQHAHNPVDWYPWGEEALNKAKHEDKPILVSIGYAACHWCHVMERESFENEEVAAIMNQHFINIKIDREERPDIDHIYMDAVQAMTGSGGWPLNVFLTPDGKPFYGGTYFPPVKAFNRPSWTEILNGVAQAFSERRNEIDAQADNLTEHLQNSNSFGQTAVKVDIPKDELFTAQHLKMVYDNLMKTADTVEGGFGKAPKFPQTFSITVLLRYYHFFKEEKALQQACLSLDKMIYGGIYDQLAGGFARYSTDNEWLALHFEKMLYDNALLITVLSEAYQITKNPEYERVIHETIDFVMRELMNEEYLFLSALDADSEGEEGRFYVWSRQEVESVLQEDASLFCSYYDITEHGNWENKNILRIRTIPKEFAQLYGLTEEELKIKISKASVKLLSERNKRIKPQTDDKVLLGWNALMNTALSKAFSATGIEEYRELAKLNMDAVLKKFDAGNEGLNHTYKNGNAKYPAFLDDYAYIIQALIQLQEITSDVSWLWKAKELTEFVKINFEEESTGYFFFTSRNQKDVIVRKKEIYDGATPSGNAVMVANLIQLSVLFDKPDWMGQAVKNLSSVLQAITRYPGSFGVWAASLFNLTMGINEVAIIGGDHDKLRDEFKLSFQPNSILQSAIDENPEFPLLRGKKKAGKTQVFLCKNYSCNQPVTSVNSLFDLLVKSQAPEHNN